VNRLAVFACAVLAAGLFAGCGENVDENKPLSEVKKEVAVMDATALKAKAEACEKFLAAKKQELDKVAAKIKEIPLNKILSDESKALKAEADKLNTSIRNVSAQMKVYLEEAEAKIKASAKK